ncbi:hypothetical protein M153_3340001811 [Pseudoloma neurophilia]|uniref:Uncharacterized protein n=1 Tax=Pseudoloma neurophilia TaxID=146866 RepID=A0A0R0LYF6_9MICR|nr:hypothetical protein M153_3340001811 [Pseudoloma neurophilia]
MVQILKKRPVWVYIVVAMCFVVLFFLITAFSLAIVANNDFFSKIDINDPEFDKSIDLTNSFIFEKSEIVDKNVFPLDNQCIFYCLEYNTISEDRFFLFEPKKVHIININSYFNINSYGFSNLEPTIYIPNPVFSQPRLSIRKPNFDYWKNYTVFTRIGLKILFCSRLTLYLKFLEYLKEMESAFDQRESPLLLIFGSDNMVFIKKYDLKVEISPKTLKIWSKNYSRSKYLLQTFRAFIILHRVEENSLK